LTSCTGVIVQTTLLGFAFALILALLAALIGPFLIDWAQFRPVFEAEASRMIGLPVRVKGLIDARLLPSPSLTLHGLEIGAPNGRHTLQARRLNVEFGLGALMRGEFRAVEAQVAGPELTVAIDRSGAVELPKLSGGSVPDSLSIERLNIEDGRVHMVNAVTGSRTTFDNIWFNGDLRSLAGPFRGEGAFVTAGELYGYRISAGRLSDDGSLRLRLSLDPSDRLLTAEAEGSLIITSDKPRFEGTIAFSRPAGLVQATGQSKLKPPWRITSRINLEAGGAKLERIDFLYGSEDSGVRLTGTADFRFGPQPSFKGVLSARQLDLDRLIATPDQPMRLPADALKALIASYSAALSPPIPTELSISADGVTLGGATIQAFGADIRLGAHAWTLDRVEFRAPGLTQVRLSGRLDIAPAVGFRGPFSIETNEPGALAGWFNGRNDPATQIRPFKARGEVVLNQQEITIARLVAEIDRKAVEGRLHYTMAAEEPSRLDAELTAPELDLDALLAFADAARAGSALQPPSEITLGVALDRARIAGFDAKTVRVRFKRDAKVLLVERLSVADLGGASLNATGRVDTSGTAPRGSLALDVDARDLDGVIALAAKFAPAAAEPLRRAEARVPEAKLRVALSLDGPAQPVAGAQTNARFSVEGRVGGLRASLRGQAKQDSAKTAANGLSSLFNSDVRIEAQMDGDDGSALVALLGLDGIVAANQSPGFVNVVATGNPSDVLRVDGRILAGNLDGKASGAMRLTGEQGPMADLQLDVANADIRPLVGLKDRLSPMPLVLSSRVALSDDDAKFTSLKATLAGTELRGALTFGFDSGITVNGTLDADTLDAAAVIATAIGAPPETKKRQPQAGWSTEPYGPERLAGIEGRVELRVLRATLTPSLTARQLRTALVFRGPDITLEDFAAHVAGGRLAGRLAFARSNNGLEIRAKLDLSGVDAAAVLPGEARPALGGRLSAKLDIEASGLSPKALVGSIAGTGSVGLEDAYLSRLDPRVFDTIIRASDQGLAVGAPKIRDIVAAGLNSGRLRVPRIETTVTINAGQLRSGNAVAQADGAELTLAGTLDLVQQQMDVRLTLTGLPRNDGSSGRPDIFVGLKGPIQKPERSIDISALAGWLTVRRIDQQAKKLEALEAAAREQEEERARARPTPPARPAEAPVAAAPAAAPVIVAPERGPGGEAAPPATIQPEPAPPPARAALPPNPAARDGVPYVGIPESGAPAWIMSPGLAPPLPAPVEIRSIPRGPERSQAPAARRSNEPLRLPSEPGAR
jgi:large subunit ribosomal protein L24